MRVAWVRVFDTVRAHVGGNDLRPEECAMGIEQPAHLFDAPTREILALVQQPEQLQQYVFGELVWQPELPTDADA